MPDVNPGSPPPTGAIQAPWPPPGLELVHGRIWPIAGVIGFGDLVLGLPLLATLGTIAPLWSLGPFGDIWWLPIVATLVGGVMLVAGLAQLVSVCHKAANASRQGHGWRTIVYAAVDRSRDTGFLLQRARRYTATTPAERDRILGMRMWTSALVLGAVLLVPAGLAASVIFGRLGWVGETFLWDTAGVIPLALLVLGIVVRLAEGFALRAARHGMTRDPVDLIEQANGWNRSIASAGAAAPSMGASRQGPFRMGVFGIAAFAIAVVVPVGGLVMVGAMVQILASMAVPSMGASQVRLAAVAPLRRYRLETNAATSGQAAGEALNSLVRVAADSVSRSSAERSPVRNYRDAWWPTDPMRDKLVTQPEHITSLFAQASRLSADERRYLTKVAAHPAHEEFRVAAGAKRVDVITTRYVLPFSDSMTSWTLPIPRYQAVREGARAHVARAVIELSQGHADKAEQTVREVISVGFVLIDRGPTVIDNLIGAAVAAEGGDALEALYRATGRAREATDLGWVRSEVKRAAERTVPQGGSGGIEGALRAMSRVVVDTAAAPGFRWEYFGIVTTLAPCVSLQRLVFGAGDSYRSWADSAHATLVRDPGDEQLYALHQRGPFGAGRCMPPSWVLGMMSQGR